MTVAPGEIYSLPGLNGAGKTTLIRMLLGMPRPTAGRVVLFDAPVTAREHGIWSEVGYLVETPAAYPELTVRENLDVIRRLRRIGSHKVVDEAIGRLSLDEYADRRARTLSLGNAQRLGLAQALLHRPRLLILDEPAKGLEPGRRRGDPGTAQRACLRRHHGVPVQSRAGRGRAARAPRIGVIHSGRLRQEFPSTDLPHRVRRWLTIAARDTDAAQAALAVAGYTVAVEAGALVCRDARAVDQPDDVAVALVEAGCPPVGLMVEHEDLEAYFLRTVGVRDA